MINLFALWTCLRGYAIIKKISRRMAMDDLYFMREALKEAEKALAEGEVPIARS